ncbi:MAG: hypothetical protein N3F10_06645 [Candidatus Bathyarchaeota archaeon]|nr:hypothetical protein [Candidatus Bathyarchaeota archaeon]
MTKRKLKLKSFLTRCSLFIWAMDEWTCTRNYGRGINLRLQLFTYALRIPVDWNTFPF